MEVLRETNKSKKGRMDESGGVKNEKGDMLRKHFEYLSVWEELKERDGAREYEYHWNPKQRKLYTEQGLEFLVDAREKGVETMIFLDKSARPLAGFFRELWKRVYPGENIPAMRFMADFRRKVGREGIPSEEISKTFKKSAEEFNGKKVLLVDEIVETGEGLFTAADKFADAFPEARVMVGSMYVMNENRDAMWREEQDFLDVRSPDGSGAFARSLDMPFKNLGQHLYKKSDKDVEEVPGKVITKRAKNAKGEFSKATESWSYLLRQVGKHECLDRRSLDAIDEKIATESDLDKKTRLLKIREAYEKLIEE